MPVSSYCIFVKLLHQNKALYKQFIIYSGNTKILWRTYWSYCWSFYGKWSISGLGFFKHTEFPFFLYFCSGFGHLVICNGSAVQIICIQQKINTCKHVSREKVLTVAWSLQILHAISALPTTQWHDKQRFIHCSVPSCIFLPPAFTNQKPN